MAQTFANDLFEFKTKPKIADFEYQRIIGTGTFGTIKIAKHKETGKTFVVKILNKEKIQKMKQAQHLKNERDILFRCEHPRIVKLYSTMQDTKDIYLIMEFVQGGEIFSHLRRIGSFDVPTVRYYAAQIVIALAKLHSEDIAYRDLKPENLLLDKNGQLKLTDFGFAKEVHDLTFTLCGTPEYLAPELVLSTGHDRGVDWWALGILIYEMLVGNPPFYGAQMQIYESIVRYRPPFPEDIDPDAKDLIQRLLRKDKTKRLGCMHNGVQDIIEHPFFAGLDWGELELGVGDAPIHPPVEGESDTKNFDTFDPNEQQDPVEGTIDEADPDSSSAAFADF